MALGFALTNNSKQVGFLMDGLGFLLDGFGFLLGGFGFHFDTLFQAGWVSDGWAWVSPGWLWASL